MTKILVMSPHPDDESLGCGGTLRKHVVEGDSVHAVFLTSGERGGHGIPPVETGAIREEEARAAAAILGIAEIDFWRIPNGKLRASKRTVNKLQDTIRTYEPDIIYVTHDREMHPEHRAAARLVERALSCNELPGLHPEVRMYEVWTPLQEMD